MIDGFIKKLKNAKNIAVLTGAGISAESGIPTFRGIDGIWKKFSPEELANFDAFMSNPELVWEWYNMRKKIISDVEPNQGHYALANLENQFSYNFSIATQNIDNLHTRAGSKNVFELHGNIEKSFCVKCKKYFNKIDISEIKKIPYCECGGLIRPDVVWFGESLPEDKLENAIKAAENADFYFSIGTSGNVYPAANLPVIAKSKGAYTIEINIEKTLISEMFDTVLLGKSSEILNNIINQLGANE